MIRSFLFVLLCFSVGFLNSCTTITTPSDSRPILQRSWDQRKQLLSKIQRFQLNGKIAVQNNRDSGSATLNWMENPRQYTVSLLGPLGSNGMRLTGNAHSVMLQTSDGKHYSATTPEALLARQWGYHLPVSYLKYWIRGLPVTHLPAKTSFDRYHRLRILEQAGSTIQFERYMNVGTIDLPAKLTIRSSNLNTKIIIYRWKIL